MYRNSGRWRAEEERRLEGEGDEARHQHGRTSRAGPVGNSLATGRNGLTDVTLLPKPGVYVFRTIHIVL